MALRLLSRRRRSSARAGGAVRGVERLWGQLADLFGSGAPRPADQLVLAPRRLEPRRLLDAGAAGLAVQMLETEFVQTGQDFASLADSADEPAAAMVNTPPSNVQITPIAAINENSSALLQLTFDDADIGDSHTVEINWGDGSPLQTLSVASGSHSFSATHQYLDDNPTATPSDVYAIGVRVIDAAGDSAVGSTNVTVNNLAPSQFVAGPLPIVENGIATLLVAINDVGSQDTHKVEINWGDGTPTQLLTVPAGPRFLTALHQYVDDNPTGTPQDNYTITARVLDDDGGASPLQQLTATVANSAPSSVQLAPVAAVNEGGAATLNVSFTDDGSVDVHKIEVDWGDGTPVQLLDVPLGDRNFTAAHSYVDDNPTGTSSDVYSIKVRVLDDDGGASAQATTSVTVNNVAPTAFVVPPPTIFESGFVTLLVTFNDPGAQDTHQVEIDWGDSSAVQLLTVPAGPPALTAFHQYLDDNPTGTPQDNYAVKVRVLDDDGGASTMQQVTATVQNLAPSNVFVSSQAAISENTLTTITVGFDDPGTLDTHKVEIDWGDGSAAEVLDVVPGGRTLSASHRYLDDNPTGTSSDAYSVKVRVLDDDGGASEQITSTITVNNVAPTAFVLPPPAILENGIASLLVVFDDPGTQDTHKVEIDWGDGSAVQIVDVTQGQRFLTTLHQYADDGPTGTPSDDFTIKVRVLDDDGGASAQVTTKVNVTNLPPTAFVVQPPAIFENGIGVLFVSFTDPGPMDTHQVEVDWGDGTPIELLTVPPGPPLLTALHQYLDDNPTGTPQDNYTITVRVIDDDGGASAPQQVNITVTNLAPSNVQLDPVAMISENDLATLNLAFEDPGTVDVHKVEVNWGDGSATQVIDLVVGARNLTATHQYVDDNPTGTPQDNYTITVRVLDDDGGASDPASTSITVKNVAPLNVVAIPPAGSFNEGSVASLNFSFDDPGSQDAHNYVIDWGDGGNVTTGAAVGHSFAATHTYADNGTYTVKVFVTDDDGGVGMGSGSVVVANVPPTLLVTSNKSVNEGALLSITDIATFTDPGFDNPLNTGDSANGGEVEESFSYTIEWGDVTAPTIGNIPGVNGAVGTPTTGAFDGAHTYADNGTYIVTVTVTDDDGGQVSKTFTVVVANVDPTLAGADQPLVVDEGAAFTLAGLSVRLQDPGFDNPANQNHPTNGGEFQETFTAMDVDWGDGMPIDALGIGTRTSGSVGTPTTAEFTHAPHTYADNGTYTVNVRVKDDDGDFVTRTFTIVVNNVPPVLTLTTEQFTIDEGGTLNIPGLGSFTDAGFDNLTNTLDPSNGGETQELFTYTIDWGDGTSDTLQLPATRASGSAGVATAGTLANSHLYKDNDVDNKYTITVTLSDDDGGVAVKSFEITVLNVNPTLNPIAATDVNSLGQTTLTLSFSDPGADSFTIVVDWGDGVFVPEQLYDGPTPQSFVILHTYTEPPDPDNPADDITIQVVIQDDDFGTAAVADGESNLESDVITNPGTGNQFIRIDTTPKVPMLTFPVRPVSTVVFAAVQTDIEADEAEEEGGAAGQARATSDRYLELELINPDDTIGGTFRLPPEALANLPALFRNLPDGHYKIFLVQAETGTRRLVIEVFVRDGLLVDPGDDSEGARDRPPADETPAARDADPATAEAIESAIDAVDDNGTQPGELFDGAPTEGAPSNPPAAPGDADGAFDVPAWRRDNSLTARPTAAVLRHGATLASVALALSAAGRSWRDQVDQTLAKAKSEQRKHLKTVGHWGGKRKPK